MAVSQSLGTANVTTGLVYARSCSSAWDSYNTATSSWDASHIFTTTVRHPFDSIIASGPSVVIATRLTTLCDGHPRVVGTAQTRPAGLTTFTLPGGTITQTTNAPYPYPSPDCSVDPDNCSILYTDALRTTTDPDLADFCDFTSALATSTVPCDYCVIKADTARLLYWPVRTKGNGSFCATGSVELISGTPTGIGPNTAVIEGVTITSPTVAISFESLYRVDGCGPAIPRTIIPVLPEQVSSVRYNRTSFIDQPFDYQDLNYHCQAANSTVYTIQDQPGPDCYHLVKADAYLGGSNQWGSLVEFPSSVIESLTIGDNYAPQILPPDSFKKIISSIWGSGCSVLVDGINDPPIALSRTGIARSVTRPHPDHSSKAGSASNLPTPGLSASNVALTESITKISFSATPTAVIGSQTFTIGSAPSGTGILFSGQITVIVTTVVTLSSHVLSFANPGTFYLDGSSVQPPDATTIISLQSDMYTMTSLRDQTYIINVSSSSSQTLSNGNVATIGSVVFSATSSSVLIAQPTPSSTPKSDPQSTTSAIQSHRKSSRATTLKPMMVYVASVLLFLHATVIHFLFVL